MPHCRFREGMVIAGKETQRPSDRARSVKWHLSTSNVEIKGMYRQEPFKNPSLTDILYRLIHENGTAIIYRQQIMIDPFILN